jgi:outer membrane protein OmpA-like peptidoglycan-associated protein
MKTHLTFALCALGTVVLGVEGTARAQAAPGFALNRFEPSERGSEWFVADTLDLRGKVRPAIGVVADYGHKPYVLLNRDGSENTNVVTNQMFVHIGGSLVLFDRLRIGASIPLAIAQDSSSTGGVVAGQRVTGSNSGGFGDLRLAADVRLAGNYGDAFTLAFGGRVWVPTGDATKLLGDDSVRIGPRLAAAGDIGAFAYAVSLGVTYRANDATFAGHPTGSEVNFGAAVGARVLDKKLLLGPEIWGSSVVSESDAFFAERTTPLALLGSGHYTAGDFRFGLGAGPGLSHAAGTAAFRAVASFEWVPGVEPAPAASTPLPSDRDGDGVPDQVDACPDVPGVRTEDAATNGCPADRDRDGVLDVVDACPDVPGIKTSDPATNGCPADRDRDGVLDVVDACPDVPGIKTDDPKTNGCPGDRDGDGVLDIADACPDVPGPANADPKKNGCPIAFLTDTQIRITDQIKFRFGLAQLDPASDGVLQAVLEIVKTHAEIKTIKIEGHTDNVGTPERNRTLSTARAAAVADWLVKHGIDRKRVVAEGFGLTRPLEPNETDEGRAANRRVEFHIEAAPKQP